MQSPIRTLRRTLLIHPPKKVNPPRPNASPNPNLNIILRNAITPSSSVIPRNLRSFCSNADLKAKIADLNFQLAEAKAQLNPGEEPKENPAKVFREIRDETFDKMERFTGNVAYYFLITLSFTFAVLFILSLIWQAISFFIISPISWLFGIKWRYLDQLRVNQNIPYTTDKSWWT